MSDSPQQLFKYLHSIIYSPSTARLDLSRIDDEHQLLAKGLMTLSGFINEQRDFSNALAGGDLGVDPPSRDNELAAPLKMLHANLRHLTWQTQQVAKGDYNQNVDFMGDFATAFNAMIHQLDSRDKALRQEISESRKKTSALEQSNKLFASITGNLSQMIIVFHSASGSILYLNNFAKKELFQTPELRTELTNIVLTIGEAHTETEVSLTSKERKKYYHIKSYPLQWEGSWAKAFIVDDITEDKAVLKELENKAYVDSLTSMGSRFFGLQKLNELIEEKRSFTICFADLDNLKHVNDTYGHLEGDKYIITAASVMQGAFENAIVSRIGGDEFMLLIPDKGMSVISEHMEEVCSLFTEEHKQNDTPYVANISYGLAEYSPGSDMTASVLIGIADERMYENKRQNKLKLFSE